MIRLDILAGEETLELGMWKFPKSTLATMRKMDAESFRSFAKQYNDTPMTLSQASECLKIGKYFADA